MSEQDQVFSGGKWYPATRVSYQPIAGEPWTEYSCEDGTIVRVKFVVTAVWRLEEKRPDGSPSYLTCTAPVLIDTQSPRELYGPPPTPPGPGFGGLPPNLDAH